MKNKEELVSMIKKYLTAKPENLNYNDCEELIKKIIDNTTTSKNKDRLEYNAVNSYGEYIEFESEDKLDDTKFKININKFRIEDYISEIEINDIEKSQGREYTEDIKLDILFEIINNSFIAATEYNKRSDMSYEDVLKNKEKAINDITNRKEDSFNHNVTFEQKEYALNSLDEIVKESLNVDYEHKERLLKKLEEYKNTNLILASKQEIEKYDEKLKKVFYDYRFESETMENVVSRLISTYNGLSKNLDDFLNGKNSDGNFQMEDSKYAILAKELAGDMEINYGILEEYDTGSSIDPLKLMQMKEELDYAKSIENGKENTLDPNYYENLPDNVKKLYDEVTADFESIMEVDPSEPAIKYLRDRYPEIADMLEDKLQGADVSYVMSNLSEYTKYEIEEILNGYGVEYKNFLKNLNEKANRDNKKLENKQEEVYGKYENTIYDTYSSFSKAQKEAFFKSFLLGDIDHNYVAHVVMDRLEKESKYQENEIEKFKVNQITDREYSDEEFLKYNHEEFKIKKEESIKENNNTILKYFGSIAGNDEYLNELVSNLSSADNVEKELNNLSKEEIKRLYNSFENNKINGYAFLHGINQSIVENYKKVSSKCGEKIVNISDFKLDEDFTKIMNSIGDKQEKEAVLSLAADYINDKKEQEVSSLNHAYNDYLSSNAPGCKKIEDIQRFCKLKQVARIWNLKQKAALEGLKVKDNEVMGIECLVNEIKELGELEISNNNSKKDVLKEFTGKLFEMRNRRRDKIDKAIQFKDRSNFDDRNLNPGMTI